MADKCIHIIEGIQFHPCDTPRGMGYYDLNCLTGTQQEKLNAHKIQVARENQKYLYKNPEIRAIMQIIIRKLLIDRPSHDIDHFIRNYFRDHWGSITEDVNKYVEALTRKPAPLDSKSTIKEDKHVTLDQTIIDDVSIDSFRSSAEDVGRPHIAKEILNEILDKLDDEVFKEMGLQVSVSEEDAEQRRKMTEKLEEDEDDLFYDLDFELDFTTYHEEEDRTEDQTFTESFDKRRVD